MICQICTNSENNKAYRIKEMMFGLRDEFTYFECSKCGCLQIVEIPSNMERYYPRNYYSFQRRARNSFIKRFLITRRDKYALLKSGLIGRLVCQKYPSYILEAIAKARVNLESRILDVGCGAGDFPFSLSDLGMKNLVGIDPYINNEVEKDSVRILKKTIHDLPDNQKYDLIIFNHSFEHIPGQSETLSKVLLLLSKNGVCLIRMPLKTRHIWNLYGVNWVQIDAPRHFFIHTLESFEHLAKKSGLLIDNVFYDSTEFQFYGSEQYKKDIPLKSENSYATNPRKSIFTAKQMKKFREEARDLNKANQGDQASFYLMRKEV